MKKVNYLTYKLFPGCVSRQKICVIKKIHWQKKKKKRKEEWKDKKCIIVHPPPL